MSDLKSKQLAADLLQQTLASKRTPRTVHLVLGVIYPASVIAFELVTRWCAQTFFDPMPTVWHALAVSAVPAINLAVWLALCDRYSLDPKWLARLGGAAIGIAAFYALVFLPLMPLAVVGMLFYGLGVLPMAPLVSLISAARLTRIISARNAASLARPIGAGVAAGVALLMALDVPAASTRLGVQWASSSDETTRQRGLALLRTAGDEDLLLRLCYDTMGRPTGLLSALVVFAGGGLFHPEMRESRQSTAEVREIFYRVTGEPFNARPAPFQSGSWARLGDFQWDADHGGTSVGGRIKGLDLVSSRIDGSVSASDAVSYLEWVVEFRNTSPQDREARVGIALPPGGVVSRATLWVNGEEREAAYGGRGAVRAAYERVAVQQRRDPLLVTTKGADRVLAQAFPVPRDGGTIKFKLGISAPLELEPDGSARLVLPAIVDRNFSIADQAGHAVWIESKTALSATATGLSATQIASSGLHRIQGEIADAALARARPAITAVRAATAGPVIARVGMGAEVLQEVVSGPRKAPSALMIVVDGSVRVAPAAQALSAALDKIPAGMPVGMIVASVTPRKLAVAPWTAAKASAAKRLLTETHFVGGQDNTKAMADALIALEPYEGAMLLWVHGPQPITFRETSGLLEQAATRLVQRPAVVLYAVEPGPNELLPDLPWAWGARSLPSTGTHDSDLAGFLTRTFAAGEQVAVVRRETPPRLATETVSHAPSGSEHIARLWAADRVLAMMLQNPDANRKAAVELATEYRLVTAVSGAVVLETARQYEEAGLKPVGQGTVPTVPEPHEWALIILAMLALGWVVRQQRSAGHAA